MSPVFPFRRARLGVVLFAAAAILSGFTCASTEFALVAANQNAQLTTERNDETRAYVLAVDARQRASLERELDLIAQLGEKAIEATLTQDLAAATVTAESQPSEPRPYVARDAVAKLIAKQEATRAAVRKEVANKRKEITDQLDAELKKWLNDPKARQQDRIAAQLAVYANANSEFSRFMQDTGARLGVGSGPGEAK